MCLIIGEGLVLVYVPHIGEGLVLVYVPHIGEGLVLVYVPHYRRGACTYTNTSHSQGHKLTQAPLYYCLSHLCIYHLFYIILMISGRRSC